MYSIFEEAPHNKAEEYRNQPQKIKSVSGIRISYTLLRME